MEVRLAASHIRRKNKMQQRQQNQQQLCDQEPSRPIGSCSKLSFNGSQRRPSRPNVKETTLLNTHAQGTLSASLVLNAH